MENERGVSHRSAGSLPAFLCRKAEAGAQFGSVRRARGSRFAEGAVIADATENLESSPSIEYLPTAICSRFIREFGISPAIDVNRATIRKSRRMR